MLTIHGGGAQDIPFLVHAIIAAEKSGTNILSYSQIFDLPEGKIESILAQILQEDIAGSELCPSNFLIAFEKEVPVGCVSAWVEGAEGISSNIIKTNSFFYFLDKKLFPVIKDHIKIVETLDIPRAPGSLQLESIFVEDAWRGKGISSQLINHHIENHKAQNHTLSNAQIQLMAENKQAISAYLKAGFTTTAEKISDNGFITNFLPWRTRILMEKSI